MLVFDLNRNFATFELNNIIMKFLKIAILFIGLTSFAQGKVGAVDVEYIISQMPEMKKVQEQIETYAGQLDLDFNKKLGDYNDLRDVYEEAKDNLSQEELKKKQAELKEKESEIQKFQQNGARLLEIKQQEFLRPLYNKVGEALTKVAKAQDYTYITQIGQDMVYLDPNYDLTEHILNELGIEITEEEVKE